MASGKRYYWLKLKEDFFTSKRIKKLRKLAGGDTFTIIYLKMQLLAMKSDGVLRWTGLEQDFATELALDIDEDVENVKVTMAFLLNYGLAESSDNINFLFPYAVENVGSEGSSAQRMRESRKTLQISPPAETVTLCAQSCTMCAQCDGDKDIDLDKDKDLDKREKNKKKDVFSEFASGDNELLKTLRDFEKMRKSIDKPMSDRAKSMLLTKLQTFPRPEWIPILEQSIFHDWQGIFPLKDNAPTPPRGQPQTSRGASAMDTLRDLHSQYEDEE